ncbi:MAG: Holliday junction resolvase RecU [Vagococcus sp.]
MNINYPKGSHNHYSSRSLPIKQVKKNQPTFANRGMSFEEEINLSNQYYLSRGVAVIHKKPTPVQIVHVDYPKRSAAVITEAYFKEASTTDYNGIYKGAYIDFEAKETKNKTSFPLTNIHQHQIDHMNACMQQNGIVFLLIWFSSLKRCFYLPADSVIHYWHNQTKNGRKSIPLSVIEHEGFEIKVGIAPRIPYIDILDQHILKGDYSNDK